MKRIKSILCLLLCLTLVLALSTVPSFASEKMNSSSVGAGETAAPGKTRITECKNMSYGVRLKWEAVADADGYRVLKREIGREVYTCIKNTKSLEFRDRDVTPGQYYIYKVRAYKLVDGKKVLGPRSDDKVIIRVIPLEIESLKYKDNAIRISWEKHPEGPEQPVIYYRLVRKSPGDSSYKVIAKTKKTTFTDYDVESGSEYAYKVRAYSGTTVTHYGSWSDVRVMKLK